jgi:hypothetical protein
MFLSTLSAFSGVRIDRRDAEGRKNKEEKFFSAPLRLRGE